MHLFGDDQIDSIKQNPLNKILSAHEDGLRKILQEHADGGEEGLEPTLKQAHRAEIRWLLVSLAAHPIASSLLGEDNQTMLPTRMDSICEAFEHKERLFIESYDIADLVVNHQPDEEIWKAVAGLLESARSMTPVPKPTRDSQKATPIKQGSVSIRGSEQIAEILTPHLQRELTGCTYRTVPGFHEKFFTRKTWSRAVESVCQETLKEYNHETKKWKAWPESCSEDPVWAWISKIQQKYFLECDGGYHRTKLSSEL